MMIGRLHTTIGRIFTQRCFYLFVSLLALIVFVPFLGDMPSGKTLLQVVQALILVSAVAAVGRSLTRFVVALAIAIPALGFQLAAPSGDDPAFRIAISTGLYVAFYLLTVICLLGYVFSPDVMTDDKLFGAAAGYLMLGILWADIYRVVQHVDPTAFGGQPGAPARSYYDLIFMSFGCLTSNGPGDVLPVSSKVRALVILEQVSGTLFVAILIARLAGIYPPRRERRKS
jgi:ion channel